MPVSCKSLIKGTAGSATRTEIGPERRGHPSDLKDPGKAQWLEGDAQTD